VKSDRRRIRLGHQKAEDSRSSERFDTKSCNNATVDSAGYRNYNTLALQSPQHDVANTALDTGRDYGGIDI
jgi:hypothetical protein